MISNDFQELYRTIQNWPSLTINRDEIIRLVRNFGNKYSLLEDDHSTVMMENDGYCVVDSSETADSPTPTPQASWAKENPMLASRSVATLPNLPARPSKDTSSTLKSPLTRKNILKQGELIVKKESTILYPLLKKQALKTVYCEIVTVLSLTETHSKFDVYPNRKSSTVLQTFSNFDYVSQGKRDFQLVHSSGTEYFQVEAGTLESWESVFHSVFPKKEIDEIYENEEILHSPINYETPPRPPPRLIHLTNTLLPRNIYVCLYDYSNPKNKAQELEFQCGDLLHIINRDDENFFIGHKLVLPWNPQHQTVLGLVYRKYIECAYENI